jgi:hypothetical protein
VTQCPSESVFGKQRPAKSARLAELEDQLTLGIAPSGVSAAAIRHVGSTTYTFLF